MIKVTKAGTAKTETVVKNAPKKKDGNPSAQKPTFEEFLMDAVKTDSVIRLVPTEVDGRVRFYCHYYGKASDTLDFEVIRDEIYRLPVTA
jgi:hypothetical protein